MGRKLRCGPACGAKTTRPRVFRCGVQPVTSLLDVPAHLALALSLAAATAASEPARGPIAEAPPPVAAAAFLPEPVAGPYRFSERMWLRALKDDLPRDAHIYAHAIFRTSGGRYYVPRQGERRQILDARNDGALAARAARAFARSNASTLRATLKHAPTAGELYLAHLFGPEAAAALIVRVRSHPADAAAKHVPVLAETAKDLLGDRGSLTLAQLYAKLTSPLAHAQTAARGAPLASQPTMADILQRGVAWSALRPNGIAWQTQVSAGGVAAPPQ